MISLLSPIISCEETQSPTTTQPTRQSQILLPRDCLQLIIMFSDESTTLSMFLVCRSWYNAVDRFLCLADDFYYLPEMFQSHFVRRPGNLRCTIIPLPSDAIPTLKQDPRWEYVQVMHVSVSGKKEVCEGLPPSVRMMYVEGSIPTMGLVACPLLRQMDLSGSKALKDADIRCFLESVPSLESLTLADTAISDVSLLSGCRALQKLDVSRCINLTNAGIRGLEHIPTLEHLYLAATNISDVSHLSACRTLRELDLSCCSNIENPGIRGLETIPTLLDLKLQFTCVTDVSHLSACRALVHLNLTRCIHLTDIGIRGLETIPTLEVLRLQFTRITDVSHLCTCSALRALHLSGCLNLTDTGIYGLECIPTLEFLSLSDVPITDVSRLASCRALQQLELLRCYKLTDAGICGLERIPTLQLLNLSKTGITNVSHLNGSQELQTLILSHCPKLTDVGIRGLEHIPKLRTLNLQGSKKISDRAALLSAGPSVRHLQLPGDPDIPKKELSSVLK
eukprot:PhF_6_TR16971/c0_g1_i1/m.25642/K10268/FBXL2_20; F-box and leucine-rich repeat protein 2/20